MVPVLLIVAVGVAMMALVLLWLARSASLEYAATRDRLTLAGSDTLSYDVPNGQDPADILIALRQAGYESVEDTVHGLHRVLVACPGHRDRDHIRSVIASVTAQAGVAVRFGDEIGRAAS